MMAAEYDPLTEEYFQSKQLPFRVYSEIPNHMDLLGDLRGLRVIDLACGEGFYARLIKKAGADSVLGVDVSGEMIELARAKEASEPQGIQYAVCTATNLSQRVEEKFDLASTAFLFNCAKDRFELGEMFREIASCLNQGGRLCATVGDLGHRPGVDYSPYGMRTEIPKDLEEGDPYQITFLLPDGHFTITDFNHRLSTYQQLCEEAGLVFEGWQPCTVTPSGIGKYGEDFWTAWIDSPCIWRFTATKNA